MAGHDADAGGARIGDLQQLRLAMAIQHLKVSAERCVPFRIGAGGLNAATEDALKILVIEDDRETADYISRGLREQGDVIDHAENGRDGLFHASDGGYDVLIVDRMLPGIEGLGLVRMLRDANVRTPVLFLTALGGVGDRVRGLDAGGDDYLVKPFAFAELLARINALARRPPLSDTRTVLQAASFRFAAFYVAVFAGSALVLGVAVFFEARSALQQQMTARIETEVAFLRVEFQSEGLAHLIDIVRKRGQGASALDYLVQDQAGVHLAGEGPATPGLTPGWTRIEVPQASEDGGRPERVRALVSDLGDGVLLAVGGDLQQIDNLEKAIATAFLWTIGLAAMLGIVGGVLLSRAFLRRVDAISRTAEAIIDGDLTRRVPTRGTGDDLDRLAGTLNHMLDRIAILMESLRQVSSDVAYDLRT